MEEGKGAYVLSEESDSKSTVSRSGTLHRLQVTNEQLDPIHRTRTRTPAIAYVRILHLTLNQRRKKRDGTYKVDLPAPFGPMMAILESSPTSMLTFLRMSLSGVYPKVTLSSWRRGGEIFSVSGNLEE